MVLVPERSFKYSPCPVMHVDPSRINIGTGTFFYLIGGVFMKRNIGMYCCILFVVVKKNYYIACLNYRNHNKFKSRTFILQHALTWILLTKWWFARTSSTQFIAQLTWNTHLQMGSTKYNFERQC